MAAYQALSAALTLSLAPFLVRLLLFINAAPRPASALSNDYYASTCPDVESIVRSSLQKTFRSDITAPAAMIRLLFHDCQVKGCDASIMLDRGSDGSSEIKSSSNLGVRKLNIIDGLKAELEAACPQTVSCADIITLAARDAVALKGGPDISIPLGRLDGLDASEAAATNDLPKATISVADTIRLFGAMRMTVEESVAILGAHTMGVAHCPNFMNRLYPTLDSDMGGVFATSLRLRCPNNGSPLLQLIVATLDTTFLAFDNTYYRNVLNRRGLLTVDSALASDPRTQPIVQKFATDQTAFFDAFASGFVKMAGFKVVPASQGQVRLNCHSVNS